MKKKVVMIILTTVIIIVLIIGHMKMGLFTRYNFFTAQYDKLIDKPRILIYGSPRLTDQEEYEIALQMGFVQKRVNHCSVSGPQVNGYNSYNAVMIRSLEKKLGKDWQTTFDFKVDSLFRERRVNAIKEKVLSIPEIMDLNHTLDSISKGKEQLYVWVLPQEKSKPNVRVGRLFPDSSAAIFYYYQVNPYDLSAGRIMY